MDILQHLINSNEITSGNILLRLSLSFLVGAIIGLEREANNQPAGLRTHILICMGSSLIMLLSIYIPQTFIGSTNSDPGRIAAQVVSGIGFLGAGAIMKYGLNVRGLTTAASIWVIAALGLAIGAGMYIACIWGTLILLIALVLLNLIEKKIFTGRYLKRLNVYTKNAEVSTDELKKILKKHQIKVKTTDFEYFFAEDKTVYSFTIQISEKVKLHELTRDLNSISDIKRVKLQQLF